METTLGKVLIVEDDISLRKSVKTPLSVLGFFVDEAGTGEKCSRQNEHPDVADQQDAAVIGEHRDGTTAGDALPGVVGPVLHHLLGRDVERCGHEASPPRRTGRGREWYGAFLPDGRWVTTDLDDTDGRLSFFSPKGTLERVVTSAELAPGGGAERELLDWGNRPPVEPQL